MLVKCVGSKCALKFSCERFLAPSVKHQVYAPFDVLREEWQGCDFYEKTTKTKEGEDDVRQNGKGT